MFQCGKLYIFKTDEWTESFQEELVRICYLAKNCEHNEFSPQFNFTDVS